MIDKSQALEILNQITTQLKAVGEKLDIENKQKEVNSLNEEMESPTFWDNPEKAQKVSQSASELQKFIETWKFIISQSQNLRELLDMVDGKDLEEVLTEVQQLQKQFSQAENELLLSDDHDHNNAILTLNVGTGGQDAEDFCQMLLRMYLRFAESKDWKPQIIEESTSDAGIKSATIEIKGKFAYGFLKGEHGVHRLIRLSPFNAKSLRQTSFARVEVLPEIENESELIIEEKDLRIDVFRSSGAGGQSVNTTDSAVRITYLPLNLVVTCQNEKSQHQNKDAAMKVLRSRLAQLKLEQQAAELQELRGDLMENSFGSQIRTYTLQPYKLVKDHRTDFEHNNPEKVFDGEIQDFIDQMLRSK